MHYAVCCVPVAALRVLPDHKTEMVSQLLFGECCTVTDDTTKGWLKITTQYDNYEGWCQWAHVQELAGEAFNDTQRVLAAGWVNEIFINDRPMHIPMGSVINEAITGMQFTGSAFNTAHAKHDAAAIKTLAFQFLNTAYLWGGRSVFGIDCSGFTQCVYRFLNIALLRDAQQQAMQGGVGGFFTGSPMRRSRFF
jgi:gamma-D-glutamyl-L-lysine dipeptidyl-peptidase